MFKLLIIFLVIAISGCVSDGSNRGVCLNGSTILDGVCVSRGIADYVSCVRAQGATLSRNSTNSLSADASYFAINARIVSDVSKNLNKKYSASDNVMAEIIKQCNVLAGISHKAPVSHVKKVSSSVTSSVDENEKNIYSKDRLVAYYPFNGGAMDKSGNDNHGIIDGANLTEDRFGISDRAYYFNGRSSIVIPDSSSLDMHEEYTLIAWIYPMSLNSKWQTILTKGPEPKEAYAMFLWNAGRLHHVNSINGSRHYWNSNRAITSVNRWYQVAVVFDGVTVKSYVNGNVSSSDKMNGVLSENNHNIEIGGRSGKIYFNGKIDDVYIYNRALSAVDIKNNFRNM